MNAVLASPLLKRSTRLAVFQGVGPGIKMAEAHGIPTEVIDAADNDRFCSALLDCVKRNEIDYVLSFYTSFYSAPFRDAMRDRIINFHPSLLPAFKGMDGFGDGIRYHAKILGTTVEFIKDVMDEGKIILQSSFPADPSIGTDRLRHIVFNQQCKSLIQIVNWICEGRVEVDGDRILIRGAGYDGGAFAPALDCSEARNFSVPFPEKSPADT